MKFLSGRVVWRAAAAIAVLAAMAATSWAAVPVSGRKSCDVRKFGAMGDGLKPDTAAIQRAIDDCSATGGSVVLESGVFLSGPLTLKSHTHLVIDEGAKLLATSNVDDFPVRTEPQYNWRRTALLHADGVTDISITGTGIVDGAGQMWWALAAKTRVAGDTTGSGAGHARPLLVDITHSDHIAIDGPTFQNSPMYNLTFFQCSDIRIENIKILNPGTGAPNTDGIDPFNSHRIEIGHVYIDTGDDCIAIKSGLVERGEPNEPTTDIHVHDSVMMHGHGLSIGSEVAGGVHNVLVENVSFKGTGSGIRIKSNRTRGNDIYNLTYRNITMENVETPVLITEYYPKIPATDTPQPMAEHTPRFHDIRIENLKAVGAKNAMTIAGVPESPVMGLRLSNVSISGQMGATIQNAHLVMQNVTITPASGEAILKGPGVVIEGK